LIAGNAVVTVPVHFDTMTSPRHSRPYVRFAKSISERFGKSILFELVRVPEEAPPVQLKEVTSLLCPCCRAVIMRIKMEVELLDQLKKAGVNAIGVELGSVPLAEADILTRMTIFNERANQHGFQTFAHGVHTISLLSAAVSAGFGYIDGGAVATAVEMPGGKKPLKLADIYAPLITTEI